MENEEPGPSRQHTQSPDIVSDVQARKREQARIRQQRRRQRETEAQQLARQEPERLRQQHRRNALTDEGQVNEREMNRLQWRTTNWFSAPLEHDPMMMKNKNLNKFLRTSLTSQ